MCIRDRYGIEEASQSGLNQVVIVTGRGKTAIEDHFDVSFELEQLLERRNKLDLLREVRAISDLIDVAYVRQKEALGLGHAVLRTKELVGPEPFAVVLSDDVIKSKVPCLAQLLRIYEYFGESVLALMEVPEDQIGAYGVVEAEPDVYKRQVEGLSAAPFRGQRVGDGGAAAQGDVLAGETAVGGQVEDFQTMHAPVVVAVTAVRRESTRTKCPPLVGYTA